MTKQNNHPQHHSAGERAAREGGLQLPEAQLWSPPGVPRWRYPTGWVTRPFWRSESRGIRLVGFVWAAILLIAVVIVVASR